MIFTIGKKDLNICISYRQEDIFRLLAKSARAKLSPHVDSWKAVVSTVCPESGFRVKVNFVADCKSPSNYFVLRFRNVQSGWGYDVLCCREDVRAIVRCFPKDEQFQWKNYSFYLCFETKGKKS